MAQCSYTKFFVSLDPNVGGLILVQSKLHLLFIMPASMVDWWLRLHWLFQS